MRVLREVVTYRVLSDSGRPGLGQGPELLEVDVSLPAALELLQGLCPRTHLASFLFVVVPVHLGPRREEGDGRVHVLDAFLPFRGIV